MLSKPQPHSMRLVILEGQPFDGWRWHGTADGHLAVFTMMAPDHPGESVVNLT